MGIVYCPSSYVDFEFGALSIKLTNQSKEFLDAVIIYLII